MSKETMTWLNTNTLIGFTDKRGHAWHYRADVQGAEPNHYPDAIPVNDVIRRLFFWDAVKGSALVTFKDGDDLAIVQDTKRFPVGRADTGDIFGYFADGYEPHQYRQWLVEKVEAILDDNLAIGSAGLLRNGAQAWVSVEVPENITTPEGVEFRPNLVACTSFDGSLSTTYKRIVTAVVCDNTLAAGLSEQGQQIKIRHSRNSGKRLSELRDALAIVHTIADDFAAEVKALCEIDVSDKAWRAFLDAHVPIEGKEKAALTNARNKRGELSRLWNHDQRVSPWRGTAFGVVQAVNTYTHHVQTVRNVSRAERNMANALLGTTDKLDQDTVRTLDKVLTSLS